MKRTTIMLPPALHARATREARRAGVSLAELVRSAVEAKLERAGESGQRDPFFADSAVYRGAAPDDLSVSHDKYLSE